MSSFEFLDMLKDEGVKYNSNCLLYYCLFGLSLEHGLVRVYTDKEVMDFCKVGLDNGMVEVYMVHGVDEPEVIEELDYITINNQPTVEHENIPIDESNPTIVLQHTLCKITHPLSQNTHPLLSKKTPSKKLQVHRCIDLTQISILSY